MNKYIWKIKHFRWKHEYSVKIVLLILFSALFFLLYINMTSISLFFHNFNAIYNAPLQFYSFYVGQGECSLVIADGVTYLYDTGTEEYADRMCDELSAILKGNGLKNIDYLIISHAHSDHYGGAKEVLRRFDVENIFRPKVLSALEEEVEGYAVSNDLAYIEMIETVEEEEAEVFFLEPCELTVGQTFLKFWTPLNDSYSNDNAISTILTISSHNNIVMLTGDAVGETENEFLSALGEEEMKVDILKVPHHGSDTASSAEFLNRINPQIAVISAGINNTYNFPAEEVIKRLHDAGASEVYVTKNIGTIGISLGATSYKLSSGFIFNDDPLLLTIYFLFVFVIIALKFPHKKIFRIKKHNF